MNPRRIVRLYEWYKAKTFCCAFFAAAMLAMVAAATIVRFPPVIMCIVKRQFLSLRVTMRHNNGSSTWKGSHFEYLLDAEYNALSIYHGHFPWNISRKTPHNSPVRVRYRVSFVNPKFGQSVTSVIVVLYYRVICGCDISKVYIDNIHLKMPCYNHDLDWSVRVYCYNVFRPVQTVRPIPRQLGLMCPHALWEQTPPDPVLIP